MEQVDIDYLVDVIEGNVKKDATKKKKKKKKKADLIVGQTLDESRIGEEFNDVEQEEFESKGSKFVNGVVKELETFEGNKGVRLKD